MVKAMKSHAPLIIAIAVLLVLMLAFYLSGGSASGAATVLLGQAPALVTFTGLLLYLLCEEGKIAEIGRLLFFAGLLSLLKQAITEGI